jgi:hypothetical protein
VKPCIYRTPYGWACAQYGGPVGLAHNPLMAYLAWWSRVSRGTQP